MSTPQQIVRAASLLPLVFAFALRPSLGLALDSSSSSPSLLHSLQRFEEASSTDPTSTQASLTSERQHHNQRFWSKISQAAPPTDSKLESREDLFLRAMDLVEAAEQQNPSLSSLRDQGEQEGHDSTDGPRTEPEAATHGSNGEPAGVNATGNPPREDEVVPVHPVVIQYLRDAAEKLSTASHIVFQHTRRAADRAQEYAVPAESEDHGSGSAGGGSLSLAGETELGPSDPMAYFADRRAAFVSGKSAKERALLESDRHARLEKLEGVMQTEVDTLGSVLSLLRDGREACWNVAKFDLYENNLSFGPDSTFNKYEWPHKVPEIWKATADQLRPLADELRKNYMGLIMGFANAIIADFGGK